MATSGTYNFALDCLDAVLEASELNGLARESVSAADMFSLRRSIQLIFAEWSSRGVLLFEVQQAVVPLSQGQGVIATGNSQGSGIQAPSNCVDIFEATYRTFENGRPIDAPMLTRISRAEYLSRPDKLDQGVPTQFFVDRQNPPVIYLWNPPDNSNGQLVYYYVSQIQDVNQSNQTFNVPYRWQPALVAGLAYVICKKKKTYVDNPNLAQILKADYEEAFGIAMAQERDKSNLRIVPDISAYSRRR